jgi:ribulose-phosphate 3-epimerase
MAEIIPAILPKTFDELEEKLSSIRGFAEKIQIDICDGSFVSSKTWPFAHVPDDRFEAIVSQEEGMPFWEDFDFEFDMMVKSPAQKIGDFVALGGSRFIIHLDSADDAEVKRILDEYGNDDMKEFGIEIGLGISATTDMKRAGGFIPRAGFVQCMGIKKIGFQGQSFDESVIERVRLLRASFPQLMISVDGGVNESNIVALAEAGADHLVVGSAIWSSETPTDALARLQELAK